MPSNLSKTLYSITARPSLIRGDGGIVGNFEEFAENLSVTVAYDGPDKCTFEITTATKPVGELAKLFYQLLGKDVAIDTGNPVWRGLVTQMILSSGTQSRRLSINDVINQVTAHHDAGITTVTVPDVTTESQLRFGVRTFDQTDTADLDVTDATLRAKHTIALNAFGRVRMVGRDERVRLRILCLGYLSTLDWCTTRLDAGDTVKEAIEGVIDDCGQGIVTYGVDTIQDNGQTWNSDIEGTGLELIRKLEQVLDTTTPVGRPWRFYIDTDNVAHWEPINFVPAYEIKQGISEASSGIFRAYYGGRKIEPFEPLAGVVIRDSTYPIEVAYHLSPFESAQDSYVLFTKFDALGNPSFESGDLVDFGVTDTYGT